MCPPSTSNAGGNNNNNNNSPHVSRHRPAAAVAGSAVPPSHLFGDKSPSSYASDNEERESLMGNSNSSSPYRCDNGWLWSWLWLYDERGRRTGTLCCIVAMNIGLCLRRGLGGGQWWWRRRRRCEATEEEAEEGRRRPEGVAAGGRWRRQSLSAYCSSYLGRPSFSLGHGPADLWHGTATCMSILWGSVLRSRCRCRSHLCRCLYGRFDPMKRHERPLHAR